MGRFFECEDYSVHNEIVDGVRELVGKFPEIFTDFEMCASIPGTTGSIALFVGDDDVIVVNTYMGDDGGEYAFVDQWIRENGRPYDYGCAVSADDAKGAVVKVLRAANSLLGYRFVADMPDVPVQDAGIEPGDDEGAVADFLDFAHNSAGEIVRIECTALKDPGDWPVVARFVVETRPDDGAVEIVHWRVERVRQG